MKKFLLSLIGLAALTATATVPTPKSLQESTKFDQVRRIDFPVDLSQKQSVIARSGSTFEYNLAEEPYSALGFNDGAKGNKVAMAFEMTPDVTTQFAGSKITHINFYTGTNKITKTNKIHEVTVFLSDGNHTGTLYTQTTQVGEQAFKYYSVKLDEPYTIEAGKDLYVGAYSILESANDYTIVIDYVAHGSNVGGWASSSANATSPFNWDNLSDYYGYVCVSATLEGDNFPQNVASLVAIGAPDYVEANKAFNIDAAITNQGQQPLQTVEAEYTVNGGEPQTTTATFSPAVATFKTDICSFPGVTVPAAGIYKISLKISKVNGEAVSNGTTQEVEVIAIPQGAGYVPNVVLEEFTGTWCGYCPVGYTTMEYFHETYTDGTLIPVAIHCSNGSQRDPMQSNTYVEVNNRFNTAGFPNSVFNRNTAYSEYPYPASSLETIYNELRETKVPAEVTLQCNFTDDTKKSIVFEGNTQFCMDLSNHNFVLSFGLTEDKVGPYTQSNYYSGEADYPEWSDKGSRVSLVYNDVARKLETIDGIEGLIPATVTANQNNSYTYTMAIPSNVKAENVNGIVYLTDKISGKIINAATVKAGKIGTSGVNDIIDDNENAPVEFFNLQGIKVENPSNGIFIRRQGTKTTKVAIN